MGRENQGRAGISASSWGCTKLSQTPLSLGFPQIPPHSNLHQDLWPPLGFESLKEQAASILTCFISSLSLEITRLPKWPPACEEREETTWVRLGVGQRTGAAGHSHTRTRHSSEDAPPGGSRLPSAQTGRSCLWPPVFSCSLVLFRPHPVPGVTLAES